MMKGDALKERTYNHVAFRVEPHDFEDYVERVEKLGLEILPGRSRVQGEGRSLYFYDYDHHLFEIHDGTLQTRLERYNRREHKDG